MNIIFLVKHPAVFNSVKSIFEAAKKHNDVIPILVVIDTNKNVFDFAKTIDENAIWAYQPETESYLKLQTLEPDFIFLSQPYYDDYPPCYRFDELCQLAKLCYVPYGFILEEFFTNSTAVPEMVRYCSFLFADNKYTYKGMLNRYYQIADIQYKKYIFNIGYPRFDEWFDLLQHNNCGNIKQSNRKILYIPRHSPFINPEEGTSSFLKLKDDILDYAMREKTDTIILRPHQKLFASLVNNKIMSKQEVIDYQDKVRSIENVYFDDATAFSYTKSFLDADILIADYSSLLIEFFITKKPIIYIGDLGVFLPEYAQLFDSFYTVNRDFAEIEIVLNKLKNGVDPKSEERSRAVDNFIKNYNKNIGEQIVTILYQHHNNSNSLVPTPQKISVKKSTTSKTHVYCFWQSDKPIPSYLSLCIDTWRRYINDLTIHTINHDNWDYYLGSIYDLEKLKTFPYPMQANAIAAAVLAEKGGVFFHIDTIVTGDIGRFLALAPNKFVHFGDPNYQEGHLGILKSPAKNSLVLHWRNECRQRIENKPKQVRWDYLGNDILNTAQKDKRYFDSYHIIDRIDYGVMLEECLIKDQGTATSKYINFYFNDSIDIDPFELLEKYAKYNLIYLHNSRTPRKYKEIKDKNEFLDTHCVLSSLLRYILNK